MQLLRLHEDKLTTWHSVILELLERQPTCPMEPATSRDHFTDGILFEPGDAWTVAALRKLLAEQELDVHTAFRTKNAKTIFVMLNDQDHDLHAIMPKLQRCVQELGQMVGQGRGGRLGTKSRPV